MMWQIRALLPDRPGAMAALATGCAQQGANILALDVHPTADGEVVDQLVVHTPEGWTAHDVEVLCSGAGVYDSVVSECSVHALEDQPVRYLRAALTVVRDPHRLEELLCEVLDAQPGSADGTRQGPRPAGRAAALTLDDGEGPPVAIRRDRAFTSTETARATALRLVATAALAGPEVERLAVPRAREVGRLRPGTARDIGPLVEMHDRCSAETLARRYHCSTHRLSPRTARKLLLPADGFSLVLPEEGGEGLVAMGMVAFQDDMVEAALLVEDRWQRRGHGTDLLRAVTAEAVRRGATELTLVARRDDTSVLATVHRAGFRAHVRRVDGVNRIRLPLDGAGSTTKVAGRTARRRATEPLVALMHHRSDLRGVHAPADMVDRAVRDGV
jgi:GNAT superfamily N-acetyltransferase